MEESITFQSKNLQLEGLLEKASGDSGVVITHPHPLYGGDMHNAVVETMMRTYRQKGFTTLRFNFRGVGGSQGSYDEGNGEQQDVISARSFIEEMGIKRIDLAGYSFGAWVNAMVGCRASSDQNMVMVSPPVAFMDFSTISELGCLKRVATGSLDDIAPADQIKAMLPQWNETARFDIIEGADHFYGGHLDKLASVLSQPDQPI